MVLRTPGRRVSARLPDFPWDSLAAHRATASAHPDGLVDLSVGTPVDPTPEVARAALREHADSPGYPVTIGIERVRQACLEWLERRHGVTGLGLDQVIPSIGSKELVATLAQHLGVGPGDTVLTVAGPVSGVLTGERTALNFASHLSGVATATSRWVDALAGSRTRVLDTRKTLPGWRALQKYAVRCGGGVNHRFSLADRAMVKDNHVVAAGGVVEAYRLVRAANPDLRIEVEVTDLDQLVAVIEAGCTEVLLDNMDDAMLTRAVELAAGRATLEASGGITLERAERIAATGVDFVSVGALTHSVTVFDLGLDFRED